MELNGTAAIVSGGASGLGEATVRDLAAAGCKVVVADLNAERGKALADEVGGIFARTDVSDVESVTAAVEAAASAGAPLRFVVSCAGIGWAQRTVGRDGDAARPGGFPQGHRRQPDRHLQPDEHRRGGRSQDRARRR